MNVYKCDACGDEYLPKKNGAGLVQLALLTPAQAGEPKLSDAGESFLAQMLGSRPASKEETYKFDLCYECGLALAVALKKQKADLKAGRRPA